MSSTSVKKVGNRQKCKYNFRHVLKTFLTKLPLRKWYLSILVSDTTRKCNEQQEQGYNYTLLEKFLIDNSVSHESSITFINEGAVITSIHSLLTRVKSGPKNTIQISPVINHSNQKNFKSYLGKSRFCTTKSDLINFNFNFNLNNLTHYTMILLNEGTNNDNNENIEIGFRLHLLLVLFSLFINLKKVQKKQRTQNIILPIAINAI